MHLFNINHRFRGLKFPAITNPLTLKKRYSGILSSDLLDYMEKVLQLEPQKRLTITQCVDHFAFNDGPKKNTAPPPNDSESSIEEESIRDEWDSTTENEQLSQRKQLKSNLKETSHKSHGHMSQPKTNAKYSSTKTSAEQPEMTTQYSFAFHSSRNEEKEEEDKYRNSPTHSSTDGQSSLDEDGYEERDSPSRVKALNAYNKPSKHSKSKHVKTHKKSSLVTSNFPTSIQSQSFYTKSEGVGSNLPTVPSTKTFGKHPEKTKKLKKVQTSFLQLYFILSRRICLSIC